MMIIVFQIMAKPHTNYNKISDCCFPFTNMSPINSKKSQEIRVAESIFKHCLITLPFQHIRLFLWWDDEPLSSSVMYVFNKKIGAMLLLRLPVPS